jgi:hypothetical protein
MRRRFLVLLFFGVVSAGCVSKTHGDPKASLPPELVVPQGATNVVKVQPRPDGGAELHYRLERAFPADDVLTEIRSAFPVDRWRPLTKQWLNPDTDTSHVTGWYSTVIQTNNAETVVHNWNGEWLDRDGNLVMYSLHYESPFVLSEAVATLKHPDNSALSATALWIPARVAKAMRGAVGVDPR